MTPNLFIIIILLCLFTIMLQYIEPFSGTIANDPVFDNAKFYQLDLNTTDEITGYPLCLKECKGSCVQYGVSGSAWCIPNN